MQAWDQIVNTALLGTDKKVLSGSELPSELKDAYELISQNTALDKEQRFLQMASVAFSYRQCGTKPIKEEITIKAAGAEDKTYSSSQAHHVLRDILEEQSHPLLEWWLRHCEANNQIVEPEIIPRLFDIAAGRKKLRALIAGCCGRRGEWLSCFNPGWNFYDTENEESIWQNGTTEQRKTVLHNLRKTEPAVARTLLQQTWSSENANTKTELLKQMEINLSADDLEWLESLPEEKSQKVKETAIHLLQRLPGSSIVTAYADIAAKSITLKKEKALLGLSSKLSLHVLLSHVDEAIFKTGIEKISNTKEFSDEEFILFQLIQLVPPTIWETQFSLSPVGIIDLFEKHKTAKKFVPAIVKAVVQFKNLDWAYVFLQSEEEFHSDLLSLLPEQQQDKYSILSFDKDPFVIIQLAKERTSEWSIELAGKIVEHTAKHTYHFNRSFYNEIIHLVPLPVMGELEKYTPKEQYQQIAWHHMSEHITKLLTLKLQTLQAFQS